LPGRHAERPDDEQKWVLEAVELLNKEPIGHAVKVRILGPNLMNVAGPDVLAAALEACASR